MKSGRGGVKTSNADRHTDGTSTEYNANLGTLFPSILFESGRRYIHIHHAKPSVLLIGSLAHTTAEWSALSTKYTLHEFRTGTRSQFLSRLKSNDFASVTALYRSNASATLTGPFDREICAALPSSLKYICHNGAGYDNIDVDAFTERGVLISSTPIAVDNATADTGIFLMLGALRYAVAPLEAIRRGEWRGKGTRVGHDPTGKVLGILGMGGIGRAMASRARAFGMKIIYHNRSRLPAELEGDAKYVTFEELLAQSDVLSLNLALNAKTRHIISAREFAKMKDGVVIVNTARGGLIKEADLVEALDSGKVSAVGLDVFEEEPKVHEGLLRNDRAFIVPHIGTNTYETQREMELLVLRNLESAVDGNGLLTPIPEQKSKANGNL
ncbi:putative 2-hydroxyacid dehydrogenase UNK4.10 [Cyphellophora attinorum]|uniref:Putative 2-hydroxyacid dehydrogenase UNK4.10 n=1 Tax=Cyphellophora attinorum TaxID=1664694 RepID=A0A0N0NL81_9EURO|nr:putative 2-hydroxyacid dehydrogenase UNK4.10 [Phialophora attinorum]KPI38729.1 putative 2-hydroxyacid dehydrogenase UNK4.10 [Phialophora attinorum]